MEYLNRKEGIAPNALVKPPCLRVDMGDWMPEDTKLRKLLQELPYPVFAIYLPFYLQPLLEDLIKRAISPNVKYSQRQD